MNETCDNCRFSINNNGSGLLHCQQECNDNYSGYEPIPLKVTKLKGIKYDQSKPRIGDFIKDFGIPLLAVSEVWQFGAEKYTRSNWKLVKNAEKRYTDAMIRHLVAEEEQEDDEESKLKHAQHVAWNSLARLYFIMKKGK